jgi:hypothetical protein
VTPRRGLFWPLLLIVIGLVFLLANFGLIAPVSVLSILGLWPLILILIGIDIAIGRRWPLAALAADVLILGAGLALVASQPAPLGFAPFIFTRGSNAPGTNDLSVPRADAKSLTFHLSGGAGTFTVTGGASDLVHARSDQDNLSLRTSSSGERMDVRVDESERGFRFGGSSPTRVDIQLASDVATSLDMNAGAGEFVVDLRDVKLTDAHINIGAASLQIVLPKATGEVPIAVSAGASSIVIVVPEGVEARVSTTGAIISSRSDNPRVAGNETAGYSSAKDRVTVRVTAAASSVLIR